MERVSLTASNVFYAAVQSCQKAIRTIRIAFAHLYYHNRFDAQEIKSLANRFVYRRDLQEKIENTLSYINELRECQVESDTDRAALYAIRNLSFAIRSFESSQLNISDLSGRVKAILSDESDAKMTRREVYLLHLISKVKKTVEQSKISLEHVPEFDKAVALLANDANSLIGRIKGSLRVEPRRIFTYREDYYYEARGLNSWTYPLRVFLRKGPETHTGFMYDQKENNISHITYQTHQFSGLRLIDILISESFLLDCKPLINKEHAHYLENLFTNDQINALWEKELKQIHDNPSIGSIKNATLIKYLAAVRFFGFAKQDTSQNISEKSYQICSEFVVRAVRISIDNLNKALRQAYVEKTGEFLPDNVEFIKNPFSHMADKNYLPSDIRKALNPFFKAEGISGLLDRII